MTGPEKKTVVSNHVTLPPSLTMATAFLKSLSHHKNCQLISYITVVFSRSTMRSPSHIIKLLFLFDKQY